MEVTEVEVDLWDASVLMSSLAALPGGFSSLCLSQILFSLIHLLDVCFFGQI